MSHPPHNTQKKKKMEIWNISIQDSEKEKPVSNIYMTESMAELINQFDMLTSEISRSLNKL